MTPLERADRAKQLLEDPVLVVMFDDVRSAIVAQIEAAGSGDMEAQIELRLLKRLRERLHTYTLVRVAEQARQDHEDWIAKTKQKLPATWRSLLVRQTVAPEDQR